LIVAFFQLSSYFSIVHHVTTNQQKSNVSVFLNQF
jgi:hypothetical protein